MDKTNTINTKINTIKNEIKKCFLIRATIQKNFLHAYIRYIVSDLINF